MRENSGYVVDRIDKGRLVVLKGVNKRTEALVNLLVSVLYLAIGLWVEGRR